MLLNTILDTVASSIVSHRSLSRIFIRKSSRISLRPHSRLPRIAIARESRSSRTQHRVRFWIFVGRRVPPVTPGLTLSVTRSRAAAVSELGLVGVRSVFRSEQRTSGPNAHNKARSQVHRVDWKRYGIGDSACANHRITAWRNDYVRLLTKETRLSWRLSRVMNVNYLINIKRLIEQRVKHRTHPVLIQQANAGRRIFK